MSESCKWRPIIEAPKDGTRLLVADSNIWMAVARFLPSAMAWIEVAASGMRLNDPTHWMKLPDPPAAEKEEA